MPVVGIRCNEEVVSFEKCLQCSKTLTNDCQFTPEVVRAITDNLDQSSNLILRATNLLDCPRCVYLEATSNYTICLEDMYYCFRGSLMHSLLEQKKVIKGSIVEKRFMRMCGAFQITGKPDYILPKMKYLRDYKTCAEVPMYKSAYPSHINQFNIYRWILAGNDIEIDNGEIVYLSMSHMKRIKIPKEKMISLSEVERGINSVATVLDKAFREGVVPPPPENYPKHWKCQGYCDVADLCFNEFRKGR